MKIKIGKARLPADFFEIFLSIGVACYCWAMIHIFLSPILKLFSDWFPALLFWFYWLTFFLACLWLGQLLLKIYKKDKEHRFKKDVKLPQRIYEPPYDYTPIVLVCHVFKADLSGIDDPVKEGNVTFKRLMQATVLDWIDRGNLSIKRENNRFFYQVHHYEKLADYELDIMELIFGNNDKIAFDQLYEEFSINEETIARFAGAEDLGLKLRARFSIKRRKIQDRLTKSLESMNLPLVYESLSQEEIKEIKNMELHFMAGISYLFYLSVFMWSDFKMTTWFSLLIAVLLVFLPTPYRVFSWKENGRLTKEGAIEQKKWSIFLNTLSASVDFNQKSIDDLILWNRYLVYMTCFGLTENINESILNLVPSLYQMDEKAQKKRKKKKEGFNEEFLAQSFFLTKKKQPFMTD